jgi:flavin reductase (DIM6/NTAB) family NADH-FMN oxidoreductase RutF
MAQHAPRGVTVNAFSSVTLDPPSILVAVAKTSTTYASLVGADAFGVNILAGDQSDLAQVFAHSGGEKFANVAWRSGISGVPILDGVCAYVEAEVEQLIHASTHTIFIGRVVAAHSSGRAPLVYLAGAFYDGERLERC